MIHTEFIKVTIRFLYYGVTYIMQRKCFINMTVRNFTMTDMCYRKNLIHLYEINPNPPLRIKLIVSKEQYCSASCVPHKGSEIILGFRYSWCWGKRTWHLAPDSQTEAEPPKGHVILIPGVCPHQYF